MRNYSIDTLKFICAILVIYIHTPQPEIWDTYITPIIRCAVPIFFMISGYYTYGKNNLNDAIKKRIIYMLKIFAWSFLLYATCFIVVNKKDSLEHQQILYSHKFLLFQAIPYGMHLWYLHAYIYVLIILLIVEKFNLYKWLFHATPILLITALIIGKYSDYFGGKELHIHTRNFLFTGLPFFAIGMIIKQCKKLPNQYITIILCLISYIVGIFEVIHAKGGGDWYASTIILSTSIFILFLNTKQTRDNIFSKIGREDSLYIYLLHFLFAIFISIVGKQIPYLPYYSAPLVFCLTMTLIKLLRKLKIIGKII